MEDQDNYSLEIIEAGAASTLFRISFLFPHEQIINKVKVKDIEIQDTALIATVWVGDLGGKVIIGSNTSDHWELSFFKTQLFEHNVLMRLKNNGKVVSRNQALQPFKLREVGRWLYKVHFNILDYQWILEQRLERIVEQCQKAGFVPTIEQKPLKPLASGNYEHVVSVRPARINSQYE